MSSTGASPAEPLHRKVGRYELFGRIAKGGMASVHLGRLVGAGAFARAVAIKQLHEQYATDEAFRQMFLNEAEILARVRHPSVVPTLDLIEEEGALYIVMEFIEGVTLKDLLALSSRLQMRTPYRIGLCVLENALRGLHAAHEARDETGTPLELVHRDVSPANILVGSDGLARVFDFGIAKALGKVTTTQDGQVKGTVPYMTPEQLAGEKVTRRGDVFSASVVLWETLTGRRLFATPNVGETMHRLLVMEVPPPSTIVPKLPSALDAVVLRGLERNPDKRYATAAEMADAIREAAPPAQLTEVGEWVKELAEERLEELGSLVAAMEKTAPLEAGGSSGVQARPRGPGGRTPMSLSVDASSDEQEARSRRRKLGWVAAGSVAGLIAIGAVWLQIAGSDGPAESDAAGTAGPSRTATEATGTATDASQPASTRTEPAATSDKAPDGKDAGGATDGDAGAESTASTATARRVRPGGQPKAPGKTTKTNPLYSIE